MRVSFGGLLLTWAVLGQCLASQTKLEAATEAAAAAALSTAALSTTIASDKAALSLDSERQHSHEEHEERKRERLFQKAHSALQTYEQARHRAQERQHQQQHQRSGASVLRTRQPIAGLLPEWLRRPLSAIERPLSAIERLLSGKGKARAEDIPAGVRQALQSVSSLADTGHSAARLSRAETLLYGKYGVAADPAAALADYRVLADQGLGEAHYIMGFFHATGLGGALQQNSLALMHTTAAAIQGHPQAAMALAFRHAKGLGVPTSCRAALDNYRTVARLAVRHYLAGPPLGRALPEPGPRARLTDDAGGAYGVRTGAARPVGRAEFDDTLEHYGFNARKGSTMFSLMLADLHYQGHRYAARNYTAAAAYVRDIMQRLWLPSGELRPGLTQAEAATAAQAAAMHGLMLLRGEGRRGAPEKQGQPERPEEAADAKAWLARAAALNQPVALNALGVVHQYGLLQTPISAERALGLFRQAAERGHAGGMANYALGIAAAQPDAALRLLRKAAEAGHVLAHFRLGEMHAGHSAEENCHVALASFRYVAEHADWLHTADPQAHQAFRRGDLHAAAVHYMRGAEMGYATAQLNAALLLERAARTGGAAPFATTHLADRAAAVYWTRAANQDVPEARVRQADHHFHGRG
ncbi:ERAD-associated protein, partial [Kickxella alabastrina]